MPLLMTYNTMVTCYQQQQRALSSAEPKFPDIHLDTSA
jgi:hypothetical protein